MEPSIKMCRNGLHPMTRANTRVCGSENYRRCLTCWSAKEERTHPRKSPEGMCRKGLHELAGYNALIDHKASKIRCRACLNIRVANRRRNGEITQFRCVSRGCHTGTWRSIYSPDRPYICPKHRAKPNLSVLTALKIRGINPRSMGVAA